MPEAEGESRTHAVRSIGWNYASYGFQIAVNLGLTAFIVRRISVPEYGLYLLVLSLSSTLNFLELGLSSVLVQSYVAALQVTGRERLSEVLSTAFFALAALGFVGVGLFSIVAAVLPGPFQIPNALLSEASTVFVVAALIIQVNLPSSAIEQVYIAFHQFNSINKIRIASTSLYTAFAVFALWKGHGIVALALAQLAASLLQFGLLYMGLPRLDRDARIRISGFRRAQLKLLFHTSKWAFLNDLSSYLFELLVWTILGSFGSMEQAALYGLAAKLPRQLWNVTDRGASILLPHTSRFWMKQDWLQLRQTYLQMQRVLFGVFLPFVALGCLIAGPLIQIWAGPHYAGAVLVLQFLLIGVISHGSGYASSQLFYAGNKIKTSAIILMCEYAASTVIALFVVPRYGAAGLAASIALVQIIINFGWYLFASCRELNLRPTAVTGALFHRMAWPLFSLGVVILAVSLLWRRLSSTGLLIAATLGGCIYLAVWGLQIALPVYRGEARTI